MGMFVLSLDCASKVQPTLQSVWDLAAVRAPSLVTGCRLGLHAGAARCARKQAPVVMMGKIPVGSRRGSPRRQRLGAVSQRAVESRQVQRNGLCRWCRVNERASASPKS